MGRLSEKVALVTGGGAGLGKADCELLALEGARVVVTDIDLESARDVARGIGGDAIAIELDVTSEDSWVSAISRVETEYGRLDILVNNAGVFVAGDVETTTLEEFRWTHAVSVEGVFLGCKHSIPLMNKNSGGSIINISSIAAMKGYPLFLAYSSAKGAIRSLTKSVARMCQEKGYAIRCNSVHPGDMETPMQQAADGRVGVERPVPSGVLPPGTVGAPADVAALVVYLASDESRFATGAEFTIDNGATITPAY